MRARKVNDKQPIGYDLRKWQALSLPQMTASVRTERSARDHHLYCLSLAPCVRRRELRGYGGLRAFQGFSLRTRCYRAGAYESTKRCVVGGCISVGTRDVFPTFKRHPTPLSGTQETAVGWWCRGVERRTSRSVCGPTRADDTTVRDSATLSPFRAPTRGAQGIEFLLPAAPRWRSGF